MDTSKTGAIVE